MRNMDRNMKKILNKRIIFATICSILILSSVVNAEQLRVSSSRYSIFSPWVNKASDVSLSANFTAYALLLNNNGSPVSGQSITFNITSPAGIIKASRSNITQSNGLASISYDTFNDFTADTDTDYGTWRISAYQTSNRSVNGSTNMSIQVGGIPINSGCENYCHQTNVAPGGKPQSPYTDNYGSTSSRAVAAHKKNQHQSYGCYLCHPGYATIKTGLYGNTSDVHKNRTCDYCHGTWTYIAGSAPNGNGIPRMPSCSDCHLIFNKNLTNISTLANLLGGNNISVYSYNFDRKAPLVAHAGINYSLTSSVPCIACHGPAHNNTKPDSITANTNGVTENSQCWKCHTNRSTTHKLNTNCIGCHTQDAHNISISAAGGGPDCISCHNVTGGSTTHRIDASAMNLGEHTNLNSNATSSVPATNKKCWGCHQTGGTQPTDMGDRYLNPYKCYDCHNATKPYSNVTGALTVSEHFKSGIDIQSAISAVDNSSSCLVCHNIAEMKVSYTDNEFTNFSLASHYGKNRSELRTGEGGSTDCKYCHQNLSTVFSGAMNNTNNNNVANHSNTPNPTCTNSTCHNTGKVHDTSLAKPTNSSDIYCKTCHTTKSEHKTLYCTECHANNTDGSKAGREIHGIKYLQKDNSFSPNKTNATDCTTCHQSSIVDNSLGTFIPEKIGVLHHSNNITNGTRWGNYWNNSKDACLYCHNDTRHNATPLGRPLIWNSSYVMRTTIGSGTNCADCHYKGDGNYGGMNSAFTGYNISPEITNGSWNGKPGYFNHTLSDYTDLTCKNCHYQGIATRVGEVLHNITEGSGGGGGVDDCIGCHTSQQGIYPGIDTASFTNHSNVNTSGGNNNISNADCKTCHYDTSNMFAIGWTTPTKICNDCHTGSSGPIIENHRPVGGPSINITTGECSTCHNNSIAKYNYSANASTSHYATKNLLVPTKDCLYCHKNSINGNYWGGTTDPKNSPTFPHSLNTTTKEECYSCHGDISVGMTNFHNKTLMKPPLSSVSCLDCHKLGTNMSKTKIDSNISSTAVHKDKNCPDCHTGATTSNMNTYSIVTNPPVACTNCHTNLEHQPLATDVRTTISCKDCHNNNGMYTVNAGTNGTENAVVHYLKNVTDTTTIPYGHTGPINTANCIICHNGPYTGDPTWGSPVNISTSTKRIHTETTTAECDNCHKDSSVSTLVNVDFHNASVRLGAGGPNCLDCHTGAG